MIDDFAPIEQLAHDLLRRQSPAERRKTLRTIARTTQKSQAARIARQLQPDGTPFAPRKGAEPKPASRRRGKGGSGRPRRKGRLRRQAMFRKLRLARYLQAGATDGEAWIGFAGRAAKIARVHQEGLEDSPAPGMAKIRYTRRVLLGLTEAEREAALDQLLGSVVAS